ncbi:MlaD family protein [Candidatus Omnitrophota bacterium]
MKYELSKEIFAGIFFFIGLVVISVSILSLGSKTGIAEPKYYFDVVFSDVGGLRAGAPVRVAGVDVGTVVNVGFIDIPGLEGKRVSATLSVLKKYKDQVDKCSIFTIKTEGLLGDKLIDIELPFDGAERITVGDGNIVVGQDPLDIKNLADDFSETSKYFVDLTKKMSDLVDHIDVTLRTTKRVMDRIEGKIIEGGLMHLFMGEERAPNK